MQFFSFILLIAGIIGIVKNIIDISRALSSDDWPKVDCTIIELDIDINTSLYGPPTFYPKIRYQYIYEGRTHIGEKLRYGPSYAFYFLDHAKEIVKRFTRGQQTRVSVNPKNLKMAVLYPGLTSYVYLDLTFYLLAFGIGLYLIIQPAA